MEKVKGQIRQKPGPQNSLGLVKFLFPNSNNIYLHDSPAKSLFDRTHRAFSHGCIRVQKPQELANMIMEDDKEWTPEKIDSTMHGGKETWYTLKGKKFRCISVILRLGWMMKGKFIFMMMYTKETNVSPN